MKTKPVWRKKRLLLPLFALFGLGVSLLVAALRSDISKLVIYNETGETIPALRLSACGQSFTFRDIEEQEALRWSLAPGGVGSAIAVELATEPPVRWQGGYVEPRGGHRVTLRVWPDGQVEFHTQVSVWQRWLKGAPDINE